MKKLILLIAASAITVTVQAGAGDVGSASLQSCKVQLALIEQKLIVADSIARKIAKSETQAEADALLVAHEKTVAEIVTLNKTNCSVE